MPKPLYIAGKAIAPGHIVTVRAAPKQGVRAGVSLALLGLVLGWPAVAGGIRLLVLISAGLVALGVAFTRDARRKSVVTLHLASGSDLAFECQRSEAEAVVAEITRQMRAD